jgi:hypothetical protein
MIQLRNDIHIFINNDFYSFYRKVQVFRQSMKVKICNINFIELKWKRRYQFFNILSETMGILDSDIAEMFI